MVYENILQAIGNTPIIKLQKMVDKDSADIYVKFEGLNVGGSIKIRTAYNMICQAEKQGLLNENSIIVEPTSGNQGIGLALIGAVTGDQHPIALLPIIHALRHDRLVQTGDDKFRRGTFFKFPIAVH